MINDSKKNACQDGIGNVSDKVKAALFVMSMICGAVASSSAMNIEVSNGLTEKKPYTTEEYSNICQTMSIDDAILKLYGKTTSAMLIENGKIIEQNVSLVAKVCQAIVKEGPFHHYDAADELFHFLSLPIERMNAYLNADPDPQEAIRIICGVTLYELLRDALFNKTRATFYNLKVAAQLQNSKKKYDAVMELMDPIAKYCQRLSFCGSMFDYADDADDADDDDGGACSIQ